MLLRQLGEMGGKEQGLEDGWLAWGLSRAGAEGEKNRVSEKGVDCTEGLGSEEGYSRPGSS